MKVQKIAPLICRKCGSTRVYIQGKHRVCASCHNRKPKTVKQEEKVERPKVIIRRRDGLVLERTV